MSLNILLIQHDPSDAHAVREALVNSGNESFAVEWTRSCADGPIAAGRDRRSAPLAGDNGN